MPRIETSPNPMPLLSRQQDDSYLYVSVAMLVLYDYVLCLNREVDSIWMSRPSWMTCCYAFLRYTGIFYAMIGFLLDLPVPLSDNVCYSLYIMLGAAFTSVQLLTVQGIMTARICALYGNSRKIVTFYCVLYAIIQVPDAVLYVIEGVKPYGNTSQEGVMMGVPRCVLVSPGVFPIAKANRAYVYITMAYDLILFVMLVYRWLSHVKIHGTSKTALTCQDVIGLLFRHGAIYFLGVLACGLPDVLAVSMTNKSAVLATEFGDISSMAWTLVACMLGPWFILSIRENHASQINGGSSTTGELVSSILFQVGAPQDDDILIIGNPHHDEDDYC